MRKCLLMMMLLLMVLPGHAEKFWYRATSQARATAVNGNLYWGRLRDVDMDICIDTTDGRVVIYSPARQVYLIRDFCNGGSPYSDGEGGKEFKIFVVSLDGTEGDVRLRYAADLRVQVYVDLPEESWVYNVKSMR